MLHQFINWLHVQNISTGLRWPVRNPCRVLLLKTCRPHFKALSVVKNRYCISTAFPWLPWRSTTHFGLWLPVSVFKYVCNLLHDVCVCVCSQGCAILDKATISQCCLGKSNAHVKMYDSMHSAHTAADTQCVRLRVHLCHLTFKVLCFQYFWAWSHQNLRK